MADQPKRDRVNDLPDEGVPAFETAPAPMTHEQAAQLAEDLEQLPNRIGDGVGRALTAATANAPAVPETPRGAPQAREASFGPGTPGDDAADVYGATQRLSGALGTVLPGFGEFASIMGKFRSIADAIGNFQDVLGSIGQLTPAQEEAEYQHNLAVAEADPAHKKALADAESALAQTKRDRAFENARSTVSDYLPSAPLLSAANIPYQPDLPVGLAAPPRVKAPEEPPGIPSDPEGLAQWYGALPPAPKISNDQESSHLRANLEMEKLRALGMVEQPKPLPPNEHDPRQIHAFLPEPPVQLTPRRPLLSDAEQAALLGGDTLSAAPELPVPPLPPGRPTARDEATAESVLPPPAPHAPEALEARESGLPVPPVSFPGTPTAAAAAEAPELPVPPLPPGRPTARDEATAESVLPPPAPHAPEALEARESGLPVPPVSFPGTPTAAAAAEAPELPVPPLPTSPAAPFLPEAPPTAAPDADNWLERMALAVSHFGDAIKDSTGAEHDAALPAAVHVGDGLTRDEGKAEPTNWREEADEVMSDLAALSASHGPRSSRAEGEDAYRVPGFNPLREVLPPGIGLEPSIDDEIGLGGTMPLPTGRGADMADAAGELAEAASELRDAAKEIKGATGDGKVGGRKGPPEKQTQLGQATNAAGNVVKQVVKEATAGSSVGTAIEVALMIARMAGS